MRKDQFGLLHHNNERDIKANTKETNLIEITTLKNDNKYIEIELKQLAYSISKINVNQNHKYYNNKLNKQQLRETIHTNQLKQKQ